MRKDVYIVARKKVASEPVLRDWTAVDAALRDLKECQYALTELGVELDRRIDGLKATTIKTHNRCRTASSGWRVTSRNMWTRTAQSWTEKAGRWYSAR